MGVTFAHNNPHIPVGEKEHTENYLSILTGKDRA